MSDFHVHTGYWIRDRYCQRALMHHSLDMSDISTIHKRWHITTSPLHVIEYQSLVKMMIIPDLGVEALPNLLKQKTTSDYQPNRNECTENTEEEELQPKKLTVPKNQSKRYNAVMVVTAKICELAKSDMDVFKMVMPQLDQIYQNSQMLRISKSTQGRTAQAIVSQSKSNLPLMPTSMKRKSKDDINFANKRCVMKKK